MKICLIFVALCIMVINHHNAEAIDIPNREFIKLMEEHPEAYEEFKQSHLRAARRCLNKTTFSAIFGGAVAGAPNRWNMAKNAGGAAIGACLPELIDEYKKAMEKSG